ncbi:MAG: thioredoxin family protein [Theionarchaea archaeon]|nr:thioredoxin family protein [Theionarchaea archaeon]MBU7039020.1 thioredoxin family protein [Theionarchaea archaeon]
MKKLLLLFIILSLVPLASAQPEVIYFYEEGCPQCAKVSLILDHLSDEGTIRVTRYSVATVEGFEKFKEYGFTYTPALVIGGQKLTGEIELSDIMEALHGSVPWFYWVLAVVLGMVSGLSPTLMGLHSDVISEVARTTRDELDVMLRSLVFYAGIFAVITPLFLILDSGPYLRLAAALLGFASAINLLNSGLHTFNSYTKIDLYTRTHFISFNSLSTLKLGFIHGFAKFPDSAPLFMGIIYLTALKGRFVYDTALFILFLSGITISYIVILLLAMAQINLFRFLNGQPLSQLYFAGAGIGVMSASVLLFWEIVESLDIVVAFATVFLALAAGGILIGFKRRLIV